MLVETYETVEIDSSGKVECEQEAIDLIDQLGLDGQCRLVKGEGDDQLRIPYAKVTKEQSRVIKSVCPKETKIYDYEDGLIPLRVLQVAAHAKELFDIVYVWHPENADEKDPYLIGANNNVGRYNTTEYFLLARWGEELLPWAELKAKAAEKIRQLRHAALQKVIGEAKAELAALEDMGDEAALVKSERPSFSDYY